MGDGDVKIKICGINHPIALAAATEAGADWLGLVFYPRSPRALTVAEATGLLAGTVHPPLIGLFVDPTEAAIAAVVRFIPLAALQIYGAADRLPVIRQTFGLPIWRPVGVSSPSDLPDRESVADRLVIEAKAPPDSSRPGGNAQRFDWDMLNGWRAPVPWALAGGLTPATVAGAIRATGARAVDVSSGVERGLGVKDPALIRAFIERARGWAL